MGTKRVQSETNVKQVCHITCKVQHDFEQLHNRTNLFSQTFRFQPKKKKKRNEGY